MIVLFMRSEITSPTRVLRAERVYFAGNGGGCAVDCRSCMSAVVVAEVDVACSAIIISFSSPLPPRQEWSGVRCRAGTRSFRSAPHRGGSNAAGSVARAGRSAVADADAAAPDEDRVAWSAI